MEQVTALARDDEVIENLPALPPKYEGYAILRSTGLKQSEASRMLGVTSGRGCQMEKKLKSKYDLTSPKFVRLASTAVKNILKGEAWGSVERINASTVLGATQMVYDRVQPAIRQTQALNVNLEISAVDYSRYMGDFTSLGRVGSIEGTNVDK